MSVRSESGVPGFALSGNRGAPAGSRRSGYGTARAEAGMTTEGTREPGLPPREPGSRDYH
jgi:hypothetical protein